MLSCAVAEIMTRSPIAVESGTSIVNTAKTMRDARIGSLFVKKGNQWVGIITETDIVQRAVANSRNLDEQTVDMIMTTPISSIDGNCMVHEARDLMSKLGVRHLGVKLAGEIVGVISAHDILLFYERCTLSKERELSEPEIAKN